MVTGSPEEKWLYSAKAMEPEIKLANKIREPKINFSFLICKLVLFFSFSINIIICLENSFFISFLLQSGRLEHHL